MKNTKILFFGMVFLLSMSFVLANKANPWTDDLVVALKFDETTGQNASNNVTTILLNGTLGSTIVHTPNGFNGWGINLTKAVGTWVSINGTKFNDNFWQINQTNYTIVTRFKTTSAGAAGLQNALWSFTQDGSQFIGVFLGEKITKRLSLMGFGSSCGSSKALNTTVDVNDGNWHTLVVTLDIRTSSTASEMWLDNVSQGSIVMNPGGQCTPKQLIIGALSQQYVADGYDGHVDEFEVFNGTMNQSSRNAIYNNSGNDGVAIYPHNLTMAASASPTATWSTPTPIDGARNSSVATFNLSCTLGDRYYIYLDGNNPPTTPVKVNSSNGTYIFSGVEGLYNYRGFCYNSTNGLASANTTTQNWSYDITFPTITLNPENEFTSVNRSRINQYDNILEFNMNFTDNLLLYGYEINISQGGITYYNITNLTLSGTNIRHKQNITLNFTHGRYNITVTVADAHTQKNISDYQVTQKKSSITFKTPNDNNIKIETNAVSDIETKKLWDRYIFNITFNDGLTTNRTFHIKTDKCPLTYLQDSPYNGHFVSYCDGSGNWIDFEGGTPVTDVIRQDDYHYILTMPNLPPNIIFESIGGLNIFTGYYSFYKGNYTINYPTTLVSDPLSLFLNLTFDSTITTTSANLTYNGTVKPLTGTITDTVNYNSTFSAGATAANYTINWTVNISQQLGGAYTSYVFNITAPQEVLDYGVGQCGVVSDNATIRTAYFYESNPFDDLNTTLELDMSIWSSDASFNKNFSINLSAAMNHTICIYPSLASLYTNAYFKYLSEGGFTQRYFLRNQLLTSIPLNVTLYNWNDTFQTSILKITVRNKDNYAYYPNIYTTLERFYAGNGTYRIVQMDRSGSLGLQLFNILEKDVDYRLKFYNENLTLLRTADNLRFLCTSGLCEITYLLSNIVNTTSSSMSTFSNYSNVTRLYTFMFVNNDGAPHTVNLSIFAQIIGANQRVNTIQICSDTTIATSGVLTCNTTTYTGTVFVSVSNDGLAAFGEYLRLQEQKLQDFIGYYDGGFITVAILITIVGFGVFSPVAVIITMIAGLVLVYTLGIFTPITISFIFVAMIMGLFIAFKVKR